MSISPVPRRTSASRHLAYEIAAASALSLVALAATWTAARAQQQSPTTPAQSAAPQGGSTLPPVTVQQGASAPAANQVAPKSAQSGSEPSSPSKQAAKPSSQAAKPQSNTPPPAEAGAPPTATAVAGAPVPPGTRSGSLGVPNTAEALAEIQTTPGGVDLVTDKEYKFSTPATTIKDALDYVPGVFVQPKWGEDSRLSIRGSGLSRNFHLRGLQLYMDGIPINTADGYGDFQEIDPSAYRYIEVFKGSNALRFGANSLGGAINFVMPTGYDADRFGVRADVGSFGFRKLSVSSGGVHGSADYFISGTWQEQDGYRDHSDGESVRGAMNLGYRLMENVETRFYLNANAIEQRIPGSLTKDAALNAPKSAAAINVLNDWQRNVDSMRIANKTTIRVAPGTSVEIGAFYVDRHLMHPIFMWLDHQFEDYGGFARIFDQREIAGFRNRLVAGVNIHNGQNDNKWFVNLPGAAKGPLAQRSIDTSDNTSFYVENAFYFLPQIALVAGTQFLHAERERDAILNRTSSTSEFDLWSPKVGLLWEISPRAQVFANVSRSAEVPSFDENTAIGGAAFTAKAQRGTTYEIGTRGATEDFTWDLALYRANLTNELMCTAPFGVPDFCIVQNADKTVHQGIEAGIGLAVFKGLFERGARPDKIWLNAAYTLNDFHFKDDALFGDNKLPGAPRHYLRAELLYKHPSGVYLGPNVEWVPEAYYVDSANTLDTKAYALLGMKVGYDAGATFSAYVEARNILDTAYIASTGITNNANPAFTNLFEPGTGRAVYAGVQVKW